MEPTITQGERCYVFRMSYLFSDPTQGDIVMFKHENYFDISRILAESGDMAEIYDGNLYVNSQIVSGYEGIIADKESKFYDNGKYKMTVPNGQYFMIGDSFEKSCDSRYDSFGCVDKHSIETSNKN